MTVAEQRRRIVEAQLTGAYSATRPDPGRVAELEIQLREMGGDPADVKAGVERETERRLAIARDPDLRPPA